MLTHAPDSSQLWQQIVWLFVLALPVATVTWTIVHEEIFREAREYCVERSKRCRTLVQRKFFYVFTCEYCLSHYVTAIFLVLTRYRLLLDDWRGYVLSLFAIVGLANAYMSLFGRLRVDIKSERLDIAVKEEEIGEAHRWTSVDLVLGRWIEDDGRARVALTLTCGAAHGAAGVGAVPEPRSPCD